MNRAVLLHDRPAEGGRPAAADHVASERLGWLVLGLIGGLFIAVSGLDIALAWYPFLMGNPEWEFGTATTTFNNLPVFVMGIALVMGAGLVRGSAWLSRSAAVLCAVLAIALLGLAALYATTVPMALGAAAEGSVVAVGIKKSIVRTAGQALLYPIAFTGLAYIGWRYSRRR